MAADDPTLLEAEISLATAEIRAFRLEAADRRLRALEQQIAAIGTGRDRLTALLAATQAEWSFRRYDFGSALATQQRARTFSSAFMRPDHPEVARAATSLAGGLFNCRAVQAGGTIPAARHRYL